MDNVSRKKRSKIMAAIKSKNTKPEKIVRSALHKMGYGFRLHRKDLPGTPDIVLTKYHTVVFVHGCFWHQHGCDKTTMPKTRKKFWKDKFEANKKRERRQSKDLKAMGWEVVIVWECDLSDIDLVAARLDRILKNRLKSIKNKRGSNNEEKKKTELKREGKTPDSAKGNKRRGATSAGRKGSRNTASKGNRRKIGRHSTVGKKRSRGDRPG